MSLLSSWVEKFHLVFAQIALADVCTPTAIYQLTVLREQVHFYEHIKRQSYQVTFAF